MRYIEVAEEYDFCISYGMPHQRAIRHLAAAYNITERGIIHHLQRAAKHAAMVPA